ncbi:hypothetical protein HZS_3838 [Henneguya salminicola]|uniref:T-complex protein 11 homolog (Trinotate prediction) n=1 Tax=Henneguya salminicola TaxID=69463 RepID=A0A6G3MF23_HENSL|nr:hypothetical protein HZS_3838 [Henneguya salminicola]
MKLACEDFNHFLNDPLFSKELFISSDLQINEYNDFPPTIRAIDETIRKKVLSSTSSDMALENPQDLCNLLLSIKAIICALSSQMLDKIQTDIENAFEMEKIKEELIRNTDNLNSRLSLIINIMGKICSPVRDRQILFLKNKQAPTIAFLKDLFVVLDDMRIDMCNFFLQHHRKKIIEHAVKFELSVFLNYCDNFKNSTNLARTRAWLQKAIETAGISNEGKEINESRVLEIVFIAYKLLLYMEEPEYPETISLDIIRINVINSLFTCSVFVSSLLNILKTHIKDLKLFDELVELKIVNIAFVLKKDEMFEYECINLGMIR